jgi:flagellin-like protein
MWIMGKHFNNRAVSAVIATLLLIAIAVAAAIIVYVFSIGLLGGLQTSGGQQVKDQVIMEAYNWNSLTSLIITLRNVGPANAQFADWFINGAAVTAPTGSCATGVGTSPLVAYTLGVGSACTATLTPATSYTTSSGVSYVIKIVTIDGAVFSYSAVAGSSS